MKAEYTIKIGDVFYKAGQELPADWGKPKKQVSEIKESGVDTVILGCTHYPILRLLLRIILVIVSFWWIQVENLLLKTLLI